MLAVARAAGETAPLIFATSIFDTDPLLAEPVRSAAERPGEDLPALRRSATRTASPKPGAWRCVLVSLHPLRQPRRPGAARPQQKKDGLMSDPDQIHGLDSDPAPRRRRRGSASVSEAAAAARCRATAERRRPPFTSPRRSSSTPSDVSVFYGGKQALTGVSLRHPPRPDHRADRPLGLRQDDLPAQPQPHERLGRRLPDRGPDPLPRPRPLRRQRRPGRGAAADRDGLPETEPVPEVDLRQRRLGAAQPRPQARASTSGSRRRCAARRCGTRSRTGSRTAPSASPAASSSGSASPARSRSSPTCCCSTSPPRRSTRSPPARSRS